ncbi:hypothetical protein JF66_07400 [Cryobacterium sp. MLB-32]|uniref:hypothetical protein n=1 Tax=Cryobacterium sp. MLB-32 TaxID=1529318 RepID=UPI0004E73114|nr:hypothetical protein [Cryobacterium sp. MLB-32]KFF60005.1 hypothetical protein JF66_07400 [Cryobacterium sp. MLB-32]
MSYFAGLSPEGTCLVIVVDDNPLAANCTKNLPLQVSAGGEPLLMLADNLPDSSDRWEKVADHLWREK